MSVDSSELTDPISNPRQNTLWQAGSWRAVWKGNWHEDETSGPYNYGRGVLAEMVNMADLVEMAEMVAAGPTHPHHQ